MSGLAIIFGILSLVFGLVFLVDCVRFRKEINQYVWWGMVCGMILVGIDTAILPLLPNGFSTMPISRLIVTDFVAFVKITIFACMGMYCCAILNLCDFPVIRRLRKSEAPDDNSSRYLLLAVTATVALGVGYSVALFKLTSPRVSDFLRQLSQTQSATAGVGARPTLITALVVLEFAFAEEIIFRLGIQNYLARQFKLQGGRYWIAIVLATSFWSLAHVNTLDPEWVKIAQVFPLGLALGYLFRRYGTEACIIAHGAFNLVMIFLSPSLISM